MPRHIVYEDLDIPAATDRPGFLARAGQALGVPFVAFAEAVRLRRTLNDLARLAPRELADIGASPELSARIQAARRLDSRLGDGWR